VKTTTVNNQDVSSESNALFSLLKRKIEQKKRQLGENMLIFFRMRRFLKKTGLVALLQTRQQTNQNTKRDTLVPEVQKLLLCRKGCKCNFFTENYI
jgi:SAM-dependent MidA family methyltransferase